MRAPMFPAKATCRWAVLRCHPRMHFTPRLNLRRTKSGEQRKQSSRFVARSDSDGIGAVNDKFGHDAGDALLKAKANALQEAGLDAYHIHGDEFQYRGNSLDELQQKLEKARQILRDEVIEVTKPDGLKTYLEGADFSYGTGQSMGDAESNLMQHKGSRAQGGNLGRKQFGGIREVSGR